MSHTIKVSDEFMAWIENIQKNFNEKRGFQPSVIDISKDMVKQFGGKFIV